MEFTLKTVYLSAMANFPPDLESQTFREAFCEKFGCARDFPECAFRQSLHLHARCLAPLIRVFSPDFFKEDLEAIVEMGNARTLWAFVGDINYLHGRHQRDRNWWRKKFLLRVSGRKLRQIGDTIFAEQLLSAPLLPTNLFATHPGERKSTDR
jgi:hypothetical protein